MSLHKTLTLESSGFTITITPMSPYYMDVIELAYKLKPAPQRRITLAGGDVYEFPFEPEDRVYVEGEDDYELWIQHKAVVAYNDNIASVRNRAREDFLLSTCVVVDDGPYTLDDVWRTNIEASLRENGWRMPVHIGEQRLLFLKTAVIRSAAERELVVKTCLYMEVTEPELSLALSMFRS